MQKTTPLCPVECTPHSCKRACVRTIVTKFTAICRNDTVFARNDTTTMMCNNAKQSSLQVLLFQLRVTSLCFAPRYSRTMPHQGQILQEVIKSSGVSITHLVDELGITRPTIYRKFKDATLDYNFVKQVGEIIGHDFSNDFTPLQQSSLPFVQNVTRPAAQSIVTPRVTSQQHVDNDTAKQLMVLQTKYIALLEAHNELLLKVYGPK